jgi:nucleotide-binding universal stress UspA family protein
MRTSGTEGDPSDATRARVVEALVVPLDGSARSARAIPVAVELAARLHADVHLFSAVALESDVTEREEELQAAGARSGVASWSVVLDNDPTRGLADRLRSLANAIVCMASHGHGRSAAVLGSVASEILAASDEPVILVGPHHGEAAPWVADAHPTSVVTCVDDTPASALLVREGLDLAELLGEPLVVLTAAEPVPEPIGDAVARRRFGPDGDVAAFLDSVVAPFRGAGASVGTQVLWDPISAADGVRSFLRERRAALVIVGTHARRGVARLVLGSVAADIVRDSPSPVLAVPRHPAG